MEEKKLQKQMTSRHITMLALGGAIGAGLFKGAGEAIGIAGPAVLLAFFLGGCILFNVMTGMGTLVLNSKEHKGGLSGIIQPFLGERSAHFADWAYWSMWMINIIAEAVAAAGFLQIWFPHVPAWFFVLAIAILTTAINMYSVRLFAETEYWLALAKIAVIIILIIFGIYLVGKEMFAQGAVTTIHAMSAHGGFMPHGIKGLVTSMLVVIYSYGGSELIAITVGETENPEKAIPKAIRGVMGRIVSFYIVPLFLLMIIYPWGTLAHSTVSPFVMVFQQMHIPFASDIVNFVIVLALFSSINSGVYASSRTLYFRLKDSQGPAGKLAVLNKNHVPQKAILFCTGTLYLGVILTYFVGDQLFGLLAGSISYTILIIWTMICVAAFTVYRKKGTAFRQLLNIIATLALIAIFIGILMTSSPVVTILTVVLYALIFVAYRKKAEAVLIG